MLFLLNDVVIDLSAVRLGPRTSGIRFQALSVDDVTRMGQELYAEHPLLHQTHRGRAERLGALIRAKSPSISAALFVAPGAGCDPDEVQVRYMMLGPHVLQALALRQAAGELDVRSADREVWRRLAA